MTKKIILIYLAVSVFTGLLMAFIYFSDRKTEIQYISNKETIAVHAQVDLLEAKLREVLSDLAFLSEHHELKNILNGKKGILYDDLLKDYTAFLVNKGIYDQVRFVDVNGMERVRVNYNNGSPSVVPKGLLQSKKNRYYFKKTISMEKGEKYISPFDLNVEHEEIEAPLKPVIRFAMPVFGNNGIKKGIVVLNYLGIGVIRDFQQFAQSSAGASHLLNKDGYWLAGPRAEDSWGFMIDERKERRFGNDFPQEWKEIVANNSGHIVNPRGLFTFETVSSLTNTQQRSKESTAMSALLQIDPMSYYWKVVSRVPPSKLYVRTNKELATLLTFYMIFITLGAVVSLIAVNTYRKQKSTENALKKLKDNLHAILITVGEGIVEIDSSSTIRFVNDEFCRIFGYTKEDLLGNNLTMLMPNRYISEHIIGIRRYLDGASPRILGQRVELDGLRKDNTCFPLELRIEAIGTECGEMRFTGAIRDITKRKLAEESIGKSLKEKEVLLTEIHHRVKNNLQVISGLLSIQQRAFKRGMSKSVEDVFEDSQNRIKSMAVIHDLLHRSGDLSSVDLLESAKVVGGGLVRTFGMEERIKLRVTGESIKLGIDQAIPVSLIINEMITNSLKHAFPDKMEGRIEISTTKEGEDDVVITFSDNGVGLPEEINWETPQSIGLDLINGLTGQIHGSIELDMTNGTSFTIKFTRI